MRDNGLVEKVGNSSIPTLHMNNKVIQLENKNVVAVVSSRVVAEDFGNEHRFVCRDIDNLIVQNCTDLFIESQYLDSQGKEQLEYLLTRDGFSLLVYGTFENPLFLAKDVAEWIEHANTTLMVNKVDEEEKVKLAIAQNVTPSHGGVRSNTEQWFLTEDGLYEVLMQSRKPNAQGQKLVSGRELHEVLGIGTRYDIWINRMIEYGFVENVDFVVTFKNEHNSKGGKQSQIEHALTLEMAKHIAMVQRTEIGMQVRNYFLEFEKYGFQENVDYTLLAKNSVNPKGGSPQSDYLLLKYPHV